MPGNGPLVSVVIPLYNHERYIKETIDSVLASTVPDFEIVVVDDGSRDASAEIVRAIRDPRIRLFVQPNMGAHHAINRGVAEARAPWVAILNSDDRFHATKLERHLAVHAADPGLEASAGRVRYVSDDGGPVERDGYFFSLYDRQKRIHSKSNSLLASLLVTNHLITTSSLFIRTECFRELGGFIPLRYNHDWFMYLTLAARGRFLILEEELVDYRRHQSNTITENEFRGRMEVAFVTEWHLHRNFSERAQEVELLEAMRLLHEKKGVCYRLMLFFELWREANGNDLEKACVTFEDRDHPMMREALRILYEEQGNLTLRDVVKKLLGHRWMRFADYVVKMRRLMN